MPELPEVETVRRGLLPVLERGRIVEYVQNRADLRFPIPVDLKPLLCGSRIAQLKRRGKYLIFAMESGAHIVWHLGMSGQIRIDEETKKHDHIVMITEDGRRIAFHDPRRFGYVLTAKTDGIDALPCFHTMGPEPLDGAAFHASYLKDKLHGRKMPVKTALLDQRIVAGLGNIYVCEALFQAGIHPESEAGMLKENHCEKIVATVQDVLNRAIAAGGSSLKDKSYKQPSGKLGYFQQQLAVYGREGENCIDPACRGIIKRITQGGRSSFYCPSHQSPL